LNFLGVSFPVLAWQYSREPTTGKRVREMRAQGLGATAIAKALGIGRASVYGVLEVG
jgi:DNA invertase Pin-like site-specific DNA recombinase